MNDDIINLALAPGDASVVNSLPPDGTVVRAKRLGWDEELTAEQEFDLEPYGEDDEDGYGTDDLEGPIETSVGRVPGVVPFVVVLVGGQEADPVTVTPTGPTGNVFCPTGEGGGVDATCSPHVAPGQPHDGGGAAPAAGHDLHTGAGLAAHVAGHAAQQGVKITDLKLQKIASLNPGGVSGGKMVFPKQGSSESAKAADKAHVDLLVKILPPGTVVKVVAAPPAKVLLGGSQPPPAPHAVGPHPDQPVQIGGGPLTHPGDPNYDITKKVKAKLGSPAAPAHQLPPTTLVSLPNPAHVKVLQTLPGSTAPKLVEDASGHKWVMKSGAGKGPQVRNEATADAVYRALGVPTPAGGLHTSAGGEVTKFTQYLGGAQTLADWSKGKPKAEVDAVHKQLGKNFALDALLGNWDVVGQTRDNVLVLDHGHGLVALRADNGGALLYRAQGAPKGGKFGKTVGELESLRDPKVNPGTAAVFGHLADADVAAQMKDVLGKTSQILQALQASGDKEAYEKVNSRLAYFEEKLAGGYGAAPPKPVSPKAPPTAPTSAPASAFHPAAFTPGQVSPLDQSKVPVPPGDAPQHLKAHSYKVRKTWTPAELAAVKTYTGHAYGELNRNMRDCPPPPPGWPCVKGSHATLLANIESALAKAPPLAEPVVVLRRMGVQGEAARAKFLAAAVAARDSGGDYTLPSFTSTTVKTNIGFGGSGAGNVRMLIEARTGVYVAPVSGLKGEKELLKSPSGRYKVVDVAGGEEKGYTVLLREVL